MKNDTKNVLLTISENQFKTKSFHVETFRVVNKSK